MSKLLSLVSGRNILDKKEENKDMDKMVEHISKYSVDELKEFVKRLESKTPSILVMAVYTKEVANISDEEVSEFKELFKKQLMLGDSE